MTETEERRGRRGAAVWVCRWWRPLVAEVAATALLVWMGLGAAVPVRGPASAPLLHVAFAFGCVVVALAMAFGPVSGAHMNPAVTLAALLYGRIEISGAMAYVVAQALGAVLGFGALLATSPPAAVAAPLGCTVPAPGVPAAAAVVIEAALTGVLVLTCCGAWTGPEDVSVPLKLGFVVAGLIFTGGHATGASLNPARSLGPALLHSVWDHHWVKHFWMLRTLLIYSNGCRLWMFAATVVPFMCRRHKKMRLVKSFRALYRFVK